MQICYCILVPLRFAFRFCVLFNGILGRRLSNAFQVNNCLRRDVAVAAAAEAREIGAGARVEQHTRRSHHMCTHATRQISLGVYMMGC